MVLSSSSPTRWLHTPKHYAAASATAGGGHRRSSLRRKHAVVSERVSEWVELPCDGWWSPKTRPCCVSEHPAGRVSTPTGPAHPLEARYKKWCIASPHSQYFPNSHTDRPVSQKERQPSTNAPPAVSVQVLEQQALHGQRARRCEPHAAPKVKKRRVRQRQPQAAQLRDEHRVPLQPHTPKTHRTRECACASRPQTDTAPAPMTATGRETRAIAHLCSGVAGGVLQL